MPEVTLDEDADPTYMEISQLRFTLAQPSTSASAKEEAKEKLMGHIDKFGAAATQPCRDLGHVSPCEDRRAYP